MQAAILDGNVRRVLARCFSIEGFPGASRTEKELWEIADSLLPARNIEAYTQGLMDLGATLCTRSKPFCAACPMHAICICLLYTSRCVEETGAVMVLMMIFRPQGLISNMRRKYQNGGVNGGRDSGRK